MTYRPNAHRTLISLLRGRRLAKKLTMTQVAQGLPSWMRFDTAKLSRVETNQRDLSYSELREWASVLGADLAELITQVEKIERAKVPRRKR